MDIFLEMAQRKILPPWG